MLARRSALIAAAGVAAVFAFYPKLTDMSSNRSHLRELRRLLGPAGDAIATDDATLAAWAPDPNYKPQQYHLLRSMDESAFRALAQQAGLSVTPSATVVEAIWRLPAGLVLSGWAADALPPGAGLRAQGKVGSASAWLRWHQGKLYGVVLPP